MQTRSAGRQATCGICLQKIVRKGDISVCRHDFCFDCIKKWTELNNTCPCCKRKIYKIKLVKLRVQYNNQPQVQRMEEDVADVKKQIELREILQMLSLLSRNQIRALGTFDEL